MEDQIKCYFEQFGKVNSVEIEHLDDATGTHFGLIEFELAETAAIVLTSGETVHRIGDNDVQVKAAEPWYQPDHILNALDDYCLRAILSKLNQLDLANAANVCIRFNVQAKAIFETKIKKLDLGMRSQKEAKNLLQTFGSMAKSVHIERPYNERDILAMIVRYCTPVLKEISFGYFWFKFNLADINCDMLLGGLERLSFSRCYLQSKMNRLLTACTELKALCIKHSSYDPNLFVWPELKKLQDLRLDGFPSAFVHQLNDIISKNLTITKLILHGLIDPNMISHSRIIREIVQKLPNLMELEFIMPTAFVETDFVMAIRCLGDLACLKVLRINLNERSAAPLSAALVQNATPIEHLQLIHGTLNAKAIESISKMKQLKVLGLCNMIYFTDERMIKLTNSLGSHLEKLEFRGYTGEDLTTIGLKKMLPFATKLSHLTLKSTEMTIDADDYAAILGTLQKRPEKTKFSFEFISGGGKVNVPESIQMENRQIFYINEKRSDDTFDDFRNEFYKYYD